MIAPKRDNINGFRASDCQIAEYNISSTLLYSTLLYFTLSIVSPEIPGNAVFSVYPRGYVLKTVFPLRLSCFSWGFWTMVCAAPRDPFINFFHLVFHFSGRSGFFRSAFRRLSTEMIENVSKSAFLLRKCSFSLITAPEMLF